jgi:hypothetical protein
LVISVPKPEPPAVPPKLAPEGPDVRLVPEKRNSGVQILSGNSLSINLNMLSSVGGVPTTGFRVNGYGLGYGGGWISNGNGTFTCPQVSNPTAWTPGQRVLVNGPNGPYEAWAPGCYR